MEKYHLKEKLSEIKLQHKPNYVKLRCYTLFIYSKIYIYSVHVVAYP